MSESMKGFMAKGRSGGKISAEYKNNCGHPMGSQRKEAITTKDTPVILNGNVSDKVVQPSKKAELSR